ncbi:hypothetical protein BJ875DRAFT_436313 [Amylocarpus encephaloides]|uniref:Uncharacterized protein n=1 Tax=Amylocarpus encephaloides TaxID=45428 RepID=A0A9P7YTP7_9HELO|nr:hypothetical protein BJ875DRAFT_436313 [Amylocarpus encephaloides]
MFVLLQGGRVLLTSVRGLASDPLVLQCDRRTSQLPGFWGVRVTGRASVQLRARSRAVEWRERLECEECEGRSGRLEEGVANKETAWMLCEDAERRKQKLKKKKSRRRSKKGNFIS